MKFIRHPLDEIHRCYSTGSVMIDGQPVLILASEGIDGPCYSYHGSDFSERKVVWEKAGGTMSIVEIPGTNGEFLATQRFFPGFNALESKVVHASYVNGEWQVKDLIEIPYTHRFDLLEVGEALYLIACTLCTSKKEREDWSDPGKILVGRLDDNHQVTKMTVIKENLYKNHGYCRVKNESRNAGLVGTDNGVFLVTPPEKALACDASEEEVRAAWTVEMISADPASDMAFFDIDGDGEEELATLEPFHGNSYKVRKRKGGKAENGTEKSGNYEVVYEYPHETIFLHLVWGGELAGKRMFLGGARREEANLFAVYFEDGKFTEEVLDTGRGPANICVVKHEGKEYVLIANNTLHEGSWYEPKQE